MKSRNLYNYITKLIVGALMGVGIGYIIALCFSIQFDTFWAGTPALINKVGNIKSAEMLAFYSALVGASFVGTKFVWNIEKWSLFKSSLVYFTINLSVMTFSGYRLYWFSHTIKDYMDFLIIYVVIFISIWIFSYIRIKKDSEKLNDKLKTMSSQK